MPESKRPPREPASAVYRLITLAAATAVAGAAATVLVFWVAGRTTETKSIGPDFVFLSGMIVMLACAGATLLHQISAIGGREWLAQMEWRAQYDHLTGLPNRDAILDSLNEALENDFDAGTAVGVLFLDLDHFKSINDSMGHDAGDEVLQVFGGRVVNAVRFHDVVGRFGGDEFLVICRNFGSIEVLKEIAQHVLWAFECPLSVSAGEVRMRPSIGIAVASRLMPASASELISNADQAMFRAKRTRSGFHVFDEEQRREVLNRREVEHALGSALDEEQFRLYYQPVMSVDDDELVSLEALVRWEHPEYGILRPDRFLAVAEDVGLSSRLGDIVLREAATQIAIWNESFPRARTVGVGINLAEHQLVDPTFPSRVASTLAIAGVSPAQIDLEIGEDLLLRRTDDIGSGLQALSAMGCRIIIDDFGSSDASLARISRPDLLDALKIDRTVVARLGDDEVARAMVEATMRMARAMNIDVIAQGVETAEQQQILLDMGIERMQGYHFLQPSPADCFVPSGAAIAKGMSRWVKEG